MGREPIYCSIANRKIFSDYGFSLKVESEVPAGGFIEVVFPSQYREYLGIPLYPQCNVRCDRYRYSVRFYFDGGLSAGLSVYLEIKNIINPEKKGGTGNFEVRSLKGSNTIDENLIFGTIGMGETPNILRSVSIKYDSTGGSAYAGESSQYLFGFKVVSFVPAGSYFRITLPKGKGYSANTNPTCSFVSVLGILPQGSMVCTFTNGQVFMRGLSQDIVEGTVVSIRILLNNPPQTVTGPLFRIEVMRNQTQYIYDWKDNFVGPDVIPGKLTSVSLSTLGSVSELSRGKTDGFQLTFTTTNPIQAGGMIEVTIPGSYSFLEERVFDKPTTYYVVSGLSSFNATQRLTLAYVDSTAQ